MANYDHSPSITAHYYYLGVRLRKLSDHTGIVNSCSIARDNFNLFVSGSDDCTAIIWDQRSKQQIQSLYHDYQVMFV